MHVHLCFWENNINAWLVKKYNTNFEMILHTKNDNYNYIRVHTSGKCNSVYYKWAVVLSSATLNAQAP